MHSGNILDIELVLHPGRPSEINENHLKVLLKENGQLVS